MAKIRDPLIHLSVEVAIRKRKCHRSKKHQVQPGESLLLIRENDSLSSKNYCKECAGEILDVASKKLTQLKGQFN